jgi:hypothetical protein
MTEVYEEQLSGNPVYLGRAIDTKTGTILKEFLDTGGSAILAIGQTWGYLGVFGSFAFNAEGNMLASGTQSGKVQIWAVTEP